MISAAVNRNNDMFLLNGQIGRATAGDQTVQFVRQRLLTYLEEWFLDETAGLPYLQSIFVKPANLPLTESLIKNEILNTAEAQELISFDFTFNRTTRIVSISFEALTEFGVVSATLKMNQLTAEIQSA